MNSSKFNRNTTLQKNKRETLIKKMVLKPLCDEIWCSLCLVKGSVGNPNCPRCGVQFCAGLGRNYFFNCPRYFVFLSVFNHYMDQSWIWTKNSFFPQHNVEGLLNSCPRVGGYLLGWACHRKNYWLFIYCSPPLEVKTRQLVFSPSRSDLGFQSSRLVEFVANREIYKSNMVSGPVF